ncbi:MAG: hypothetical protein DHS20C21_06930 [Gemmatimonadota bacterium]|nr:MAG: hypothetical protein DHS20C21_06930 [Gemmatimonadota bacterium]
MLSGYLMATTQVDSYGVRISPDELRTIFHKTPDPLLIRDSHDMSRPPAGVGRKKRLVDLPNGELGIEMDVEVLNEEVLVGKGGPSISVVLSGLSLRPEREPELVVLYNPIYFLDREIAPLVRLTTDEFQINAGRNLQRGLEDLPFSLVLKFAAASYAARFLGEMGAGHYRALRAHLRSIAADTRHRERPPLRVQIQWVHEGSGQRAVHVVAEAQVEAVSSESGVGKTQELLAQIEQNLELGAAHVGFRYDRDSKSWQQTYAVDEMGREVGGA